VIEIRKKEDCCGCHACVQKCPKQCITMQEDEEGFLYPKVNEELCINCGLCEKVCPVINQSEPRKPLKVYAAKNPNEEIRMKSSSGGIFTMLAERTINNGGVVFGARFNDQWEVIHDYTETIEGIAPFRGSKYVQSTIGNNYQIAEQFLKKGREVLFTGTPCQIAGLNKYLQKNYDNLITVNVVCQGVPSPLIWREYLEQIKQNDEIKYISFRDKSRGWKSYSIKYVFGDSIIYHKATNDNYLFGFRNCIFLRPSCHLCPSKLGKCYSDITLGDYWGIYAFYSKYDDDKGVSLVLVNSDKGMNFISDICTQFVETSLNQANYGNPMIKNSAPLTQNRKHFWDLYSKVGISSIKLICNQMKPSIMKRFNVLFIRVLKK
jgi:coenzyme F420-reducing hydrogenase beta subunit